MKATFVGLARTVYTIYTPHLTVCMVTSLLTIPCIRYMYGAGRPHIFVHGSCICTFVHGSFNLFHQNLFHHIDKT